MAEVTVLGAGVFGLSVALACARAGARVQVIDPRGPGGGASGGLVGALAPHAPEQWTEAKAFQRDCLLAAGEFWEGVAALTGRDPGFARSGRLQPLADAAAVARAQARAVEAAALWQGRADWRVEPAPAGWGPVAETGLVVRDTLSARVHPRRAVAALAAAVTALGGSILTEGVGRGAIVHATGWEGLVPLGGAGVKGQAALLAHDARDLPQIYAPGLHVVPHADGKVAVGSTSERDWADPVATDAQLDAVIARARAVVPALADAAVVERWAGVRPRSRSRSPILGPYPERPGEWIANGGFKIGFALAPRVGELMARAILDGEDAIPPGFRA